ncbi:hypothetical protein HMPREF9436_01713 [Faecalibacterium cf. prausnitzii KLE1255]|uniref:Uncharacterized protein n=1 Tax=Faecalibacterium cf. prausnitzii KLE1255 TaxID=748224 RepID=E2ZJ67_9FIRM|nr:hypothetical protein HMPREF9436_01713 [Faecalibacterium cf. prausnitzii KLE1255]
MPCRTTWFQNLYTNIVCGFDGIIDPFCAVVNGFFEKSGIEILFTLLYNRLKTQSITNKGSTLL